jgi:hypothetical protein
VTRGNNVIDLIAPPPSCLTVSREAWSKTPAVIREEILRMAAEFATGFEKYRPAAERWGDLAEFDEMATKGNTTVKEALSKYIAVESQLRRNPEEALLGLMDSLGIDAHEWARAVMAADAA